MDTDIILVKRIEEVAQNLVEFAAKADSFEDLVTAYIEVAFTLSTVLDSCANKKNTKELFHYLYKIKNLLNDLLLRQYYRCSDLHADDYKLDEVVDRMHLFNKMIKDLEEGKLIESNIISSLCKTMPPSSKNNLIQYIHKSLFTLLEVHFFNEDLFDTPYNCIISKVNFLNSQISFPILAHDLFDEESIKELKEELSSDVDGIKKSTLRANIIDNIYPKIRPFVLGSMPQIRYFPVEASLIYFEIERALAVLSMITNRDANLNFQNFLSNTEKIKSLIDGEKEGYPIPENLIHVQYSLSYINKLLNAPVKLVLSDREIACIFKESICVIQIPTYIGYYVESISDVSLNEIWEFHQSPAYWVNNRTNPFIKDSLYKKQFVSFNKKVERFANNLTIEKFIEESFRDLNQNIIKRLLSESKTEMGVQLIIAYGAVFHADQLLLYTGIQNPKIHELAKNVILLYSGRMAKALVKKTIDLDEDNSKECDVNGKKQSESIDKETLDENIKAVRDEGNRIFEDAQGTIKNYNSSVLKIIEIVSQTESVNQIESQLNDMLEKIKNSNTKIDDSKYIASDIGSKFHKINCPFVKKIKANNITEIKDYQSAINSNYVPCNYCLSKHKINK